MLPPSANKGVFDFGKVIEVIQTLDQNPRLVDKRGRPLGLVPIIDETKSLKRQGIVNDGDVLRIPLNQSS